MGCPCRVVEGLRAFWIVLDGRDSRLVRPEQERQRCHWSSRTKGLAGTALRGSWTKQTRGAVGGKKMRGR